LEIKIVQAQVKGTARILTRSCFLLWWKALAALLEATSHGEVVKLVLKVLGQLSPDIWAIKEAKLNKILRKLSKEETLSSLVNSVMKSWSGAVIHKQESGKQVETSKLSSFEPNTKVCFPMLCLPLSGWNI